MTSFSLDNIAITTASDSLLRFLLQEMLLRGSLILLVASLLILLLSPRSASVRSVLWLMLISALALLPLFSLLLPGLAVAISSDSQLAQLVQQPWLATTPTTLAWLALPYTLIASTGLIYLLVGIAQVRAISARSSRVQDPRLLSLANALQENNGIQSPVQLLFSNEIQSPLTWGLFRHHILLPEDARQWPAEMLSQCLSHELAHIQRMDWASHILSRLVLCLYWFNPLVWLLQARLIEDTEKACDEAVIDDTGCPVTYAENLLWLAGKMSLNRSLLTSPHLASHWLGCRSLLYRRVRYILADNPYRCINGRSNMVAGLIFSVLLLWPVAAIELDLIEAEVKVIPADRFQVNFYPRSSQSYREILSQFYPEQSLDR
jgi:beta-lactamase regulating signal transducer with metallopeptidase domain